MKRTIAGADRHRGSTRERHMVNDGLEFPGETNQMCYLCRGAKKSREYTKGDTVILYGDIDEGA